MTALLDTLRSLDIDAVPVATPTGRLVGAQGGVDRFADLVEMGQRLGAALFQACFHALGLAARKTFGARGFVAGVVAILLALAVAGGQRAVPVFL